jgi:hypothetical protein
VRETVQFIPPTPPHPNYKTLALLTQFRNFRAVFPLLALFSSLMCDRARVVKAGRNQNASLPDSEVLEQIGHKGWGLSPVSHGPYGSTRFPIRRSEQGVSLIGGVRLCVDCHTSLFGRHALPSPIVLIDGGLLFLISRRLVPVYALARGLQTSVRSVSRTNDPPSRHASVHFLQTALAQV